MYSIPIPMFDMAIEVFTDFKEFEEKSDYTITDEDGVTAGNLVYIGNPKDIYTIIHESVHVVDWILEVRLDFKQPKSLMSTTELRAYMTDWVSKEIIKCLDK